MRSTGCRSSCLRLSGKLTPQHRPKLPTRATVPAFILTVRVEHGKAVMEDGRYKWRYQRVPTRDTSRHDNPDDRPKPTTQVSSHCCCRRDGRRSFLRQLAQRRQEPQLRNRLPLQSHFAAASFVRLTVHFLHLITISSLRLGLSPCKHHYFVIHRHKGDSATASRSPR